MNKRQSVALAVILVVGISGCRGLVPPNWSHPGPAQYQQAQAERFDPYPENEPGPKIVGARPLEYEKPPAEVLRVQPSINPFQARWLPWNWGR